MHKKVQCINNINSILFTKSLSFVDQTERTLGTLTKGIKLNNVIVELQKNICLVDCRIFRMDLNTEYINKTLNIHNQRGDIEIILISGLVSGRLEANLCVCNVPKPRMVPNTLNILIFQKYQRKT